MTELEVFELQRQLAMYKSEVKRLRSEVQSKSYDVLQEKDHFSSILDLLPDAIFILENDQVINVNKRSVSIFGFSEQEFIDKSADEDIHMNFNDGEHKWRKKDGVDVPVWVSKEPIDALQDVVVVRDISQRKKIETQLIQTEKLVSMGQLAAGIAHEINTPVQFISDTVSFLEESYADMNGLIQRYKKHAELSFNADQSKDIENKEREIDLCFIMDETAPSFKRIQNGIERISKIVKSMRDFAHPDSGPMEYADLSEIIESTLTVSKSEYRYVANILKEFSDLPNILCHVGKLGQVLLNLIVNASHAIEGVSEQDAEMGTISIKTEQVNGMVCISVADTGGGIADDVMQYIFDPFFTTKHVGKGTGQGLALVYGVIVDQHHGTVDVKNIAGGVCFTLRFPMDGVKDGELNGQ
ncbi:MAG: PAS domain-containing protein [Planctomycetes bacterium]|nr:PAS domain-containing protein [Planctomycetota bacterium]